MRESDNFIQSPSSADVHDVWNSNGDDTLASYLALALVPVSVPVTGIKLNMIYRHQSTGTGNRCQKCQKTV